MFSYVTILKRQFSLNDFGTVQIIYTDVLANFKADSVVLTTGSYESSTLGGSSGFNAQFIKSTVFVLFQHLHYYFFPYVEV